MIRRKPPRLVEKNGYWNLVFYNPETRRRRWHALGTSSKTTAKRRVRRMERAWEDGQFDPFRERFEFEAYTFKRAVERYLDDMKARLKPKSLRSMHDVLVLLVDDVAALTIQQIEPRHVQVIINRPPSSHSRLSYFRKFRVFFRWCCEQGLRTDDPTDDIPRPKVPKKNPVFLRRAEFQQLMVHMEERGDTRMAEIVRFTVATGGRLGEICQLQFGDVDPESGLVHFRATGGRTNKSNRDRVVPLVPIAQAVYERQVAKYPSQTVPRSAPLFAGAKGEAIRDGGSFTSHRFKKYVREAGLSDEYCFHTLRHTFASWLRLAGVPLDRIQYWLGHSSITTTEVYAHLIPEAIRYESARVFPEQAIVENIGLLLGDNGGGR